MKHISGGTVCTTSGIGQGKIKEQRDGVNWGKGLLRGIVEILF